MENAVLLITWINIQFLLIASSLNITNPPQNITVCINNVAEINCGFTGADTQFAIPNWIITMRSDDGSIVSNETVFGSIIAVNLVSGLRWEPDRNSGANNAPNSKLLFGPVNKIHNQSSFQCFFQVSENEILATSSIGTIIVVGPPSVDITIDEVCVTSITLSLAIYSHSACGAFSHHVNLLLPDNRTISPVSENNTTYTFDKLATNTSYVAIVTVINDSDISDFQVFSKLINTRPSSAPDPIDADTISISSANNDTARITWKKPTTNTCLMTEIKGFKVNIRCNNGESLIMTSNKTVITFLYSKLLNNELNISCVITIVVNNNEGMSSEPSSKAFAIPDDESNNNSGDDNGNSSSGSGSGSGTGNSSGSSNDNSVAAISGSVAALILGIIILVAVLCLCCFCRHKNNTNDGKKKLSPIVNIQAGADSYSYCFNSSSEVTAYAISGSSTASTTVSTSGPNSSMMMLQVNTQSNTARLHEPSHHNKHESIHGDNTESAPALPPKLVYADLQLDNNKVRKTIITDKHVPYAETIKTE